MRMNSFSIISMGLLASAVAGQDMTLNFVDSIKPLFQESCIGCHRQGRAKNGLRLDDYNAMMEGGSAGPSIIKGDPDASLLYLVMAHEREPFMPRGEPKLDEQTTAIVRQWIAEGARASATDASFVPKPVSHVMTLDANTVASPDGAPAMPTDVRLDAYWWAPKPNTINALATSPFAPLVAIGGLNQVVLYNTATLKCVGVFDFPEGDIHSLRFSPNGTILIAGGGIGATAGRAVAWDVTSGARVLELGDEPDLVLSTDVSEDHRFVALGGPSGVVRVFDASTGDVIHKFTAHTDWITSTAFSPDGVLLATGDRAGNIHVWETWTGREFSTPPAHMGRITSLAWRSDSQILAATSANGRIRLLDAERGRQQKAWTSHGGVLGSVFDRTGRLATVGRDGRARLWTSDGTQVIQTDSFGDETTAVAVSADGERLFIGGWRGDVHVCATSDGHVIGELNANPPTSFERLHNEAVMHVATLVNEHTQADARLVLTTATLDAERVAEAEATAALKKAAAEEQTAQSLAAEHQQRFDQATALLQNCDSTTATKKKELQDATALLHAAAETLQVRETELRDAIAREASAEANHVVKDTDKTRSARTLATTLRTGAQAIATEASVAVARRQTANKAAIRVVESWSKATTELRTDATATIETARTIFAAHERLQLERDRLQSIAAAAKTTLALATTTAATLAATITDVERELVTGRAAVTSTAAAWEKAQDAILTARGRVP